MVGVHLPLGRRSDCGEVDPLASIPPAYPNVCIRGATRNSAGWGLPYLQERYSVLVSDLIVGAVRAVRHALAGSSDALPPLDGRPYLIGLACDGEYMSRLKGSDAPAGDCLDHTEPGVTQAGGVSEYY